MLRVPGCLNLSLLCSLSAAQTSHGQPPSLFFDYGYGFKATTATATERRIGPSQGKLEVSEVCEGDTFHLACPAIGSVIHFANHSFFHFGRGGAWEKNTSCGNSGGATTAPDDSARKAVKPGPLAHCSTVNGRQLLAEPCGGRSECRVVLTGRFPARDPCPPVPDGNGTAPVRKYLIFRYSCVPVGGEPGEPANRSSPSATSGARRPEDDDDLSGATEDLIERINYATEVTEDLLQTVASFLDTMLVNLTTTTRMHGQSALLALNITDRISKELLQLLNKQNTTGQLEIKTNELRMVLVRRVSTNLSSQISWQVGDDRIVLPDQQELLREEGNKPMEVAIISYNKMQDKLDTVSQVVSVAVGRPVNLSKPVLFYLANNGTQNVSCAYWSFPADYWAQDGCTTVCHNSTHTKCSCNHLTNFALIFNVHQEFVGDKGVHSSRLRLLTYAGFSVSILCMALTILLFLMHRSSQRTERDVIHVNLCLSLLSAEVVFLFGIEQTADAWVCMGIAISLHFLFLSSFAWMFMEGYQIYVMLVKVFETRNPSRRRNFLLGYGVPLSLVGLSFCLDAWLHAPSHQEREDMCYRASSWSSYGTEEYCWLRVDNLFILSFIIPAVLVIFCNLGFLLFAIRTMLIHKPVPGNNRKMIVSYMKGVLVLMCLLGSTWISGLVYLAINSLYLAYAFIILNSLQGVGIFIFQCLLNPAVKPTVRRKLDMLGESLGLSTWRSRQKRAPHTEMPGYPHHGPCSLPYSTTCWGDNPTEKKCLLDDSTRMRLSLDIKDDLRREHGSPEVVGEQEERTAEAVGEQEQRTVEVVGGQEERTAEAVGGQEQRTAEAVGGQEQRTAEAVEDEAQEKLRLIEEAPLPEVLLSLDETDMGFPDIVFTEKKTA